MTEGQSSLVVIENASRMLAEADTIQKVKEFKSLALTAADWARRKGMGEEVVRRARGYALRAEIRLGQMISESELAKGGEQYRITGTSTLPVVPTLAELGISKRESSESQKLAALPPETQERIIAGEETKKAHVSHNSGENEWYTPPEIIDAVRLTMDGISLDPASSEKANKIVNASKFYTIDDDGLSKPWAGRVFMNPPYAQPLITQFCEKLVAELGNITEAVVLVNNATETTWFQAVACRASAICFPRGRIRFWEPNGKISAPLQGQAILYIGPNARRFASAFCDFGLIVTHDV